MKRAHTNRELLLLVAVFALVLSFALPSAARAVELARESGTIGWGGIVFIYGLSIVSTSVVTFLLLLVFALIVELIMRIKGA